MTYPASNVRIIHWCAACNQGVHGKPQRDAHGIDRCSCCGRTVRENS